MLKNVDFWGKAHTAIHSLEEDVMASTGGGLTASQQTRYIEPMLGLMLGRRRRRWANISPALAQCIVFSGCAPGLNQDVWCRCNVEDIFPC